MKCPEILKHTYDRTLTKGFPDMTAMVKKKKKQTTPYGIANYKVVKSKGTFLQLMLLFKKLILNR